MEEIEEAGGCSGVLTGILAFGGILVFLIVVIVVMLIVMMALAV